jgi:hypothetical protein
MFFSETQTQDIFHDTLEPNPGEAREPGAKFGVKECYRVDPGFTKAGKILVSCMNNPFEVGQFMRDVIECPDAHGINQVVGCSFAVGLDQVCPRGIAETTRSLRVECQWP